MTNEEMVTKLYDMGFDSGRGDLTVAQLEEADRLRNAIAARMLPEAGGEEAIDAIRDQIESPYVLLGRGWATLDGTFTLDQLKTICAEITK